MEPLTLAGIVTIAIAGALTRIGEMTLDGSIDKLKKLIQRKSPNTFKQLEASANNPEKMPETIKIMATLIEEDSEIKKVAETVAKENESKPYVVNQFEKLEKIVNFANRNINIKEQIINF